METHPCNMCQEPAVVLDTEYDEYYCHTHARQYEVYDGPHLMLTNEPGPFL